MINVTKIAKSNIKYNKSKSILIIVTILLATTLLASVSMVGLDWNELNKQNVIKYSGTYHGLYGRVDETKYDKIKAHVDIETTGIINGIGVMEEFEDETKIALAFTDENAFKLNSLELIDGKLPTKKNEVAIDDLALKKLGYEQKLNQTIEIKYEDYTRDEIITEKFIVTGITKANETAQIKKGYSILVSQNYMNSTRDISKENFNVFFTLKNVDNMSAYDVESMVEEIGENFDIKKVYTKVNENYINSTKPDSFVVGSVVVISLVIILSSILVIYNIFYLSIITKVQEFGKLRAIGTTKKQIKKIILKEGMYLSSIAIPLGLLAGYIISEVIVKYLLGGEVSISKWLLAIIIGLISILTVYISLIKPMKVASKISIVEAVKYNGESNSKKKTRKGYDYINVSRLTKANLKSNKKRTYVTLLSLTLSGILFIVVSCALESMDAEKMTRDHMPHDINIRLDNYTFGDEDSPNTEINMLQKKNLLSDEFIDELKQVEGVKNIEVTSNTLKAEITNIDMEYKYDNLTGIDENDLEYMNYYLEDGEIDLEKLKTGKEIVFNHSYTAEMYGIKAGDTISLKIYDGDNIIKKDFKIQAITDGPGVYAVHNDYIEKIAKTSPRNSIGLTVEKNKYDEVKAYIETLVKGNENLDASYIDESIASNEFAIRLTKVMGYSLVTLIGVIGFINLINSMITSIITRKKELGMLQAIGLTNKQLVQMLNKEAMFYTSFMLVGSLTVGNIIGYVAVEALKKSGMNYAVYELPINQMIIMVVCIIAAQLLLTYLISKNFNKESLIDRVRYND
ncbi:MAG: ABC transporter permease [Peptostreptococcaceae bacterium]